jgi:hypothetical protein
VELPRDRPGANAPPAPAPQALIEVHTAFERERLGWANFVGRRP